MEKNIMVQFKVINIFDNFKSRSKPSPPLPDALWRNPLYFIAFGFGSGAMPFAPGTFGTLMAIPFYLFIRPLPLPLYLLVVVLFIAITTWICDLVSHEIQIHDHPGMCIDEFAGFFVTMINAPPGWKWIVLGFVLFRIFDIWKPWPIRSIDEKVPGGIGMELDDIVAGMFSLVIMQLLRTII
jgi:phosphatidylglycerophosphatase A